MPSLQAEKHPDSFRYTLFPLFGLQDIQGSQSTRSSLTSQIEFAKCFLLSPTCTSRVDRRMAKKQRKKAVRRPLCYTHVGVQVAPTKRSTHDPAAALSHRQTEVAMA